MMDAPARNDSLSRFENALLLDDVLGVLSGDATSYELLAHWTQGEFHHDLVFDWSDGAQAGRHVLVVSTNCNGGVKELLLFDDVPERLALWRFRCPDNPAFSGQLPPVVASLRTVHWFDPCELLADDARSELRPEFRERQEGGGWVAKK